MIKSGNDIQWVHKSEIGNKNCPDYDVHLGVVMRRDKHNNLKPYLHFRLTEAGFKALNCKYVLYAYDEESHRIFFKEGDQFTGYSIQKNLTFSCSIGKRMSDALQMYADRYTFDRLSDGTLFIQLEESELSIMLKS